MKKWNGIDLLETSFGLQLSERNEKAFKVYCRGYFIFYKSDKGIIYVEDNDDVTETVIELGKNIEDVENFLLQFYNEEWENEESYEEVIKRLMGE